MRECKMTTIKVPYLATVWAVGSLVDNKTIHPVVTSERKRALKPGPFYSVCEAEFTVETLGTKSFVKFSINDGGIGNPDFCLDSDGQFYFVTDALEYLSNLNINEHSSFYVSDIHCARISVRDENPCGEPRKFEKYWSFFGSASDLSEKAVIVGEGYDADIFTDIQTGLDKFVMIDGQLCIKTREPLILIRPGHSQPLHLICESPYEDIFSDDEYISCNEKLLYSLSKTFAIVSIFQANCLTNIRGDHTLLNKEDNRNLTEFVKQVVSDIPYQHNVAYGYSGR